MAYLEQRTFTTDCPAKLIDDVNAEPEIGATLEQIINDGGPVSDFWFNSPLDAEEETYFDNILATWECEDVPDPVDPDEEEIDYKIDHKRDKIAGFVKRSDAWLDFDYDTGELTIITNPNKPEITSFKVWSYNTPFDIASDSIIVPVTAENQIVYYTAEGNLAVAISGSDEIEDDLEHNAAILARISTNVTSGTHLYVLDLRYEVDMDPETRITFVKTVGATYNYGLALQEITANTSGDLDEHAQFSIEDGSVFLADIEYRTEVRTQQLSFPARIPIWYKIGQQWKLKQEDDFPLVYTGTVGDDYAGFLAPYNAIDPDTGDGSLVETPSNDYFCVHYLASPGLYRGVVGVQGQFWYKNGPEARAGAPDEIGRLLASESISRFYTPIGTVIWQTAGGKDNPPHCEIASTVPQQGYQTEDQDYIDLRYLKAALGSGAGVPTPVIDHLSSTSPSSALSANQGRVLNENKSNIDHTHALPDLTDVDLTSPAENEVLTYNGQDWINQAGAGGGGDVTQEELYTKRDKIAGIEGRSSSWMEFDFNTGLLTITANPNTDPVTEEFTVWSYNNPYVKTTDTVTVPTDAGYYYVFYDENGDLVILSASPGTQGLLVDLPLDIKENAAFVAKVTIDYLSGTYEQIIDLRYDVQMDPSTRNTFVNTNGTVYGSGLGLYNLTVDGDGSQDIQGQFGIEDGTINLADIVYNTSTRDQVLSFPAQIPIAYRLGNLWKRKPEDNFPTIYSGSVGDDYVDPAIRLPYNFIDYSVVPPVGELIEVPDGDYVCVHYFATLGLYSSIFGTQGQQYYQTITQARSGALDEISNILVDPNLNQFYTPVATVIFQTDTTMTNSIKAKIVSIDADTDYLDLRTSKLALNSAGSEVPASFNEDLFNIFDERQQRLLFDLSNTNPIKSQDVTWYPGEYDMDFRTVPEYKLIAPAAMPIPAFSEVSMNINGAIQVYPATGGESSTQFTTKTTTISSMAYTSENTGVQIYCDGTAGVVYFKSGTAQPDGSTLWGNEQSQSISGTAIEIHARQINDTTVSYTTVTNTGILYIQALTVNVSSRVISPGNLLEVESSGSISACLSYNTRSHIVIAYLNGSSGYVNYYELSGNTLTEKQSRQSFDPGSNPDHIECASDGEEILFMWRRDDGTTLWQLAKWRNQGGGSYSRFSNQVTLTTDSVHLAGFESHNGTMFGQVKKTDGSFQSYFSPYTSTTVTEASNFGPAMLNTKSCGLVNSASGLGYNLVVNDVDRMEIWEGSASDPSAGFTKIFQSTFVVPQMADYYHENTTMFESTFVMGFDKSNVIYFVNGASTRTDNYIGNAKFEVAQGEDCEVLLGLPVIAHTIEYAAGDVFYLGPYKYQAIGVHQVVMIVEELTPIAAGASE